MFVLLGYQTHVAPAPNMAPVPGPMSGQAPVPTASGVYHASPYPPGPYSMYTVINWFRCVMYSQYSLQLAVLRLHIVLIPLCDITQAVDLDTRV